MPENSTKLNKLNQTNYTKIVHCNPKNLTTKINQTINKLHQQNYKISDLNYQETSHVTYQLNFTIKYQKPSNVDEDLTNLMTSIVKQYSDNILAEYNRYYQKYTATTDPTSNLIKKVINFLRHKRMANNRHQYYTTKVISTIKKLKDYQQYPFDFIDFDTIMIKITNSLTILEKANNPKFKSISYDTMYLTQATIQNFNRNYRHLNSVNFFEKIKHIHFMPTQETKNDIFETSPIQLFKHYIIAQTLLSAYPSIQNKVKEFYNHTRIENHNTKDNDFIPEQIQILKQNCPQKYLKYFNIKLT